MSEPKVEGTLEKSRKRLGGKLMARAMRERWRIPSALRGPLIRRLGEIVEDPHASPREVLAAASALLAASKINLDNVGTALKVQVQEEFDVRLARLEEQVEQREQLTNSD